MSEYEEGGGEWYPDQDGYFIDTDYDVVTGMYVASARKEGARSLHAIGATEGYARAAVKRKIGDEKKRLRAMGS